MSARQPRIRPCHITEIKDCYLGHLSFFHENHEEQFFEEKHLILTSLQVSEIIKPERMLLSDLTFVQPAMPFELQS
jgi:hypothetical protein